LARVFDNREKYYTAGFIELQRFKSKNKDSLIEKLLTHHNTMTPTWPSVFERGEVATMLLRLRVYGATNNFHFLILKNPYVFHGIFVLVWLSHHQDSW